MKLAQRALALALAVALMSGCYNEVTVTPDALEAAAQACAAPEAASDHPLVYRDRKGRPRVAQLVDASGQPTGKSVIVDHRTRTKYQGRWVHICHSGHPYSSEADQQKPVRRADDATTIGVIAATVATVGLVLVPVFVVLTTNWDL